MLHLAKYTQQQTMFESHFLKLLWHKYPQTNQPRVKLDHVPHLTAQDREAWPSKKTNERQREERKRRRNFSEPNGGRGGIGIGGESSLRKLCNLSPPKTKICS
uniref:(northern house mosquito) hypothetical protein n=1 Tax=Culex pipiens TaxID=7175 RepID=A0A8D8AZP9_CULPI